MYAMIIAAAVASSTGVGGAALVKYGPALFAFFVAGLSLVQAGITLINGDIDGCNYHMSAFFFAYSTALANLSITKIIKHLIGSAAVGYFLAGEGLVEFGQETYVHQKIQAHKQQINFFIICY